MFCAWSVVSVVIICIFALGSAGLISEFVESKVEKPAIKPNEVMKKVRRLERMTGLEVNLVTLFGVRSGGRWWFQIIPEFKNCFFVFK